MDIEQLKTFFNGIYVQPEIPGDKYLRCLFYPVFVALLEKGTSENEYWVNRDEILPFILNKYQINSDVTGVGVGGLRLDHLLSHQFGPADQDSFLNKHIEHKGVEAGDTKSEYRLKDKDFIKQFLDLNLYDVEAIKKQILNRVNWLANRESSNTNKQKVGNVNFDKSGKPKLQNSLNQILYGPPGTGKTFATIDETLRILDPTFLYDHLEKREDLKVRFDQLLIAGHVSFVKFHQSFSYEDFVEGLRAQIDDNGQLSYYIQDGVFKNLCITAAAKVIKQAEAPIDLVGRRIWKMSLGNTLGVDSYIYEECIN